MNEPTGEADEGEAIPGLIEQMEREDEEANGVEDGDCDNDNDDDAAVEHMVLGCWSNYDNSQFVVNESESVRW